MSEVKNDDKGARSIHLPGSPRGVACPRCGRKGLHFAPHPHAFGWKDYGRVRCRFCRTTFRREE